MPPNPSFDIGISDVRVRLPTTPRPKDGLLPRGTEAIRPGVIFYPKIVVDMSPGDAMQPIAAVYVADDTTPTSPTEGVALIDALDRCTWTLARVVYEAGHINKKIPPQIDWEVRATMAGVSETKHTGSMFIEGGGGPDGWTYEENGFITQVSGVLCTQWEFWARLHPSELVTDGVVSIRLFVGADRMGGPFETQDGRITMM